MPFDETRLSPQLSSSDFFVSTLTNHVFQRLSDRYDVWESSGALRDHCFRILAPFKWIHR